MITISDVRNVIYAIIPLYVALIAGYLSLKLWKLFTPDQCSGINKFVSKISIPLLSFQVISASDPFKMNLKLVLADSLQKVVALIILAAIVRIRSSKGRLGSVITGFSVSTLPNTLIIGIPLIQAMYGDEAAKYLAQIVVLQSIVWYNILLILFEFGAAKDVMNVQSPSEVLTGHVEAPQETESEEEGDQNNGRIIKEQRKKKKSITVILSTVAKKLMTNPNTYATFAGLIWASIHFRWAIKMPKVIEDSIKILSNGGLGMAMFSLGLFMASQASFIACGTKKALLSIAMKFLPGPILMAVSSILLGLRGTLLKVAIVQAALPQGIVPFVFAKDYNIHADILSTGVVVGMLLAIPIGLAYYFLLAL